MKEKLRKGLSLILFLLGLFIFSTAPMNVTGAVIGAPQLAPGITSLLGIVLMFAALMVFTAKNDGVLENIVISNFSEILREVEKNDFYNPVILDANFIIDSCKDGKQYKHLSTIIKDAYEKGHPLILPESVKNEVRIKNRNDRNYVEENESRKKSFLNNLAHFTIDLSESRPDYNKKKFKEEKSNKPDVFLKDKYFNAAKIILEDTPKYLGFKYSVRLKEENIDEIAFLNDERKKNKDALIFKVFKDYEILKILHQVKRDYERNNTNFSSYGIDKADTEVLANALYLSKHPDVVAGKDALPVNIYSSDDHLSQGVRVVNEKYSKIKDKIRINNFNM